MVNADWPNLRLTFRHESDRAKSSPVKLLKPVKADRIVKR
jgi:hypothetical protein